MTTAALSAGWGVVGHPPPPSRTGQRPAPAGDGTTFVPIVERRLTPTVRDVAIIGDRVRCLLASTSSSCLADIDLATGQEVRRIESLPLMKRAWFTADGHGLGIRRTAAIGRGPTRLTFLDPAGRVIVESSVPDATSEIALGSGRWYIGCRDGGLYAFGWDGQPAWIWTTPGPVGDDPDPYARRCPYYVAARPSGVVVASFADLYAIDVAGRTTWHAQVPAAGPVPWTVGEDGDHTDEHDDASRTLGLSPGADDPAVKAAYRRLARATHPDHHPDDSAAASKFARVQRAYERLLTGEPTRARSALGMSLTVAFGGTGPTITFLTTHPDDTVIVGSSEGCLYHVDVTGRLEEERVLGDRPMRAARRHDGTLGIAACGNTLLFVTENRAVPVASLINEPRRMTMLGEDVVVWSRHAWQVIDSRGRGRWSTACATPLTHVATQGTRLVCVARTLSVFHTR